MEKNAVLLLSETVSTRVKRKEKYPIASVKLRKIEFGDGKESLHRGSDLRCIKCIYCKTRHIGDSCLV